MINTLTIPLLMLKIVPLYLLYSVQIGIRNVNIIIRYLMPVIIIKDRKMIIAHIANIIRHKTSDTLRPVFIAHRNAWNLSRIPQV